MTFFLANILFKTIDLAAIVFRGAFFLLKRFSFDSTGYLTDLIVVVAEVVVVVAEGIFFSGIELICFLLAKFSFSFLSTATICYWIL